MTKNNKDNNNPAYDQEHFIKFAKTLKKSLVKYGKFTDKQLLVKQKEQLEALVKLERQFRKTLIDHRWGKSVYKDFIKLICEKKRNILAARPYFRERQPIFTSKISKALKARRAKALYPFHFNYGFIVFVLGCRKWRPNSPIRKLATRISNIRNEIIEMNLPLAISRARIFWSRTPRDYLSYMDLVQISTEGLVSAVDKFCLPYSSVFRSVIIGRSVGNLIEETGQTLLHFYPTDKRKLYRAHKAAYKYELDEIDKLTKDVNDNMDRPHHTNSSELSELMNAASTVSIDSPPPEDDSIKKGIEYASIETDQQPDVKYEQTEAMTAMQKAILQLSIFEQKVLYLKGVQF